MRTLAIKDINEFASRSGVSKRDVQNFLNTVGQAGSEEGDLLNLYYEARLYSLDNLTVETIEEGIRLAYADEMEPIHTIIETPLPGGHYSLWPLNNR